MVGEEHAADHGNTVGDNMRVTKVNVTARDARPGVHAVRRYAYYPAIREILLVQVSAEGSLQAGCVAARSWSYHTRSCLMRPNQEHRADQDGNHSGDEYGSSGTQGRRMTFVAWCV